MAKEPFVINLKKPEDSAQDIANKLNSLSSAIDITVINGAVTQKDFEAYKEVNDSLVKGYEDRVNYNIQEGRKKLNDLRYHGAGLSKVIHNTTLSGDGTIDNPLGAIVSGGTVVNFSLVPANGFSGTVASSTTTPALTLTVTVASGSITKSNGSALVAATPDVDYLTPLTASSTYLNQGQATGLYLSITSATAIYLSQSLATATYIPRSYLTANAITASANTATVPVASVRNIVTNNSASGLTITMATSGALSMQPAIVQILPSSAASQSLVFVNTENSALTTAPSTIGSSTTIPISTGFLFNAGTSKWTIVASS